MVQPLTLECSPFQRLKSLPIYFKEITKDVHCPKLMLEDEQRMSIARM
jgi:hypothetical protein